MRTERDSTDIQPQQSMDSIKVDAEWLTWDASGH
jgi:hypothetical protein